jgi:hypothetical protein
MGRRAARALVGVGLASCALLAAREVVPSAATATSSTPRPVLGAVTADGRPASVASGWTVGRAADGRYLVVVEGTTDLSLTSWDGVADVAVTPEGDGVTLVDFAAPDGRRVDAGFTFVAR